MTVKDRLQQIVAVMNEDEAAQTLAFVDGRLGAVRQYYEIFGSYDSFGPPEKPKRRWFR